MLFTVLLQAIDPIRNLRRQYSLAIERDLLSDWIVRQCFGRIGANGRSITTIVESEGDARRLARSILRRRATALRRIGVAYRPVRQFSEAGWEDLLIPASLAEQSPDDGNDCQRFVRNSEARGGIA